MFPKFIHTVVCVQCFTPWQGRVIFQSVDEPYFILILILSPINGYLHYFHLFVILKNAATSMCLHVFGFQVTILLGIYLGQELLAPALKRIIV